MQKYKNRRYLPEILCYTVTNFTRYQTNHNKYSSTEKWLRSYEMFRVI